MELARDLGDNGHPDTVAGQLYFGRQHYYSQKANVETLIAAADASNAQINSGNLNGNLNCRVLRNDLIRFEDACYDPIYRWYVGLVLIAIMLLVVYFYFLLLCCGLGKQEEKPKKEKPAPRKPVQDTVEDDVVDINDNEKIPIS